MGGFCYVHDGRVMGGSKRHLRDVFSSGMTPMFISQTIMKKLFFENLTLAPIEKELIDYKSLSKLEQDYLFRYHLEVYSKISPYLNKKEKKWLAEFIQ